MASNDLVSEVQRAFRRFLRGDFTRERATSDERAALAAVSPPVSAPAAQDYVAWRRSLLWVAGIALLVVGVLQIVTFTTMEEMLGGNVSEAVDLETIDGVFALLIVPVFVGGALALWAALRWREVRASRRIARIGFLVNFLTPFLVAALPIQGLLEHGAMAAQDRTSVNLALGTYVGLRFSALLGPRAIALFPGIIRSSMALKTLVPESPMPGWAAALLAPLYSIFLLVVFALIIQVQGNALLLIGLGCLMISPMVYVWRAKAVLRPHRADELAGVLGPVRLRASLFTGLGVVFIGIFLIDMQVGFLDILLFVLAIVGNVVLLTVVGGDFLLALLKHGHDQSKALLEGDLEATLEGRFEALSAAGLAEIRAAEPGAGPPG